MSAEFIMSLAKEIDRLRDVLAEIRLLTNNPDDNGLAVVKVYHAATMGLNDDVGNAVPPLSEDTKRQIEEMARDIPPEDDDGVTVGREQEGSR